MKVKIFDPSLINLNNSPLPPEHNARSSPNFRTFHAGFNIQWWIETLFELFMLVPSIHNHGDKRRYIYPFLPHSHNCQWNFMQTITVHGGLLYQYNHAYWYATLEQNEGQKPNVNLSICIRSSRKTFLEFLILKQGY